MRGENIKQSWDHDTGAYGRCSHCGRYSDDPKCLTDGFKCNCGMAAGFSGSFKRPLEGSTWCNPPKSEGEKQNSIDNTTKFAIQEMVDVLEYFVNNAPVEEQAWMKERLKIVLEQSNVCERY